MSAKQLLKRELYNVRNCKSERRESLYFATNRILTGVTPEDLIDYLNNLHKLTKSVGEKMRYANDIKFVKSLMKNDTT